MNQQEKDKQLKALRIKLEGVEAEARIKLNVEHGQHYCLWSKEISQIHNAKRRIQAQ